MHAFTKLDDGDIYIWCSPNKVYFNCFFRTLYAFHHFKLSIIPHFIGRIFSSAIWRTYIKGGKSYFFAFSQISCSFSSPLTTKTWLSCRISSGFSNFVEKTSLFAISQSEKSWMVTKFFAGGVRCGVAQVKIR